MTRYEQENAVLLQALQTDVQTQEIHGVSMQVKPVPDPMPGTVLDPRVYRVLEEKEKQPNPWAQALEIPVALIRQDAGYPNRDISGGTVCKTKRVIPARGGGVTLYCYTPQVTGPKPAVLFFHGGAFIAGSTKIVENFCKLLAELAGTVVIGVEYRLAPEHPFPAGQEDCYDAFNWVCENAAVLDVDTKHIAVAGDSAGGTLAIGCCLLEHDAGKNRICYEALLYPGVLVDNFKLEDYRWRLADYDIPEDDLLAMGAAVSLKAMTAEMPQLYMGQSGHVKDPLAAPLCRDNLRGLPQTLMILCEYDYLRLSAEAFSRKMARDGVAARTVLYCGMDHAFIDKIGDYPQAYDAAVEIAKDLKRICAN